jgi:hypothetical protein
MFMVLVFYGDENVSQVTIVNDVCVCTYMQEEDNTPWDPLPGYCSVHLHLREENNSPKSLPPSLPPSLSHTLSHTHSISPFLISCAVGGGGGGGVGVGGVGGGGGGGGQLSFSGFD